MRLWDSAGGVIPRSQDKILHWVTSPAAPVFGHIRQPFLPGYADLQTSLSPRPHPPPPFAPRAKALKLLPCSFFAAAFCPPNPPKVCVLIAGRTGIPLGVCFLVLVSVADLQSSRDALPPPQKSKVWPPHVSAPFFLSGVQLFKLPLEKYLDSPPLACSAPRTTSGSAPGGFIYQRFNFSTPS